MLPFRDHVGLAPEEEAALRALLAPLRTLQDVVRMGFARRPPLMVKDVIRQDEFTHDVVLPLSETRYLAFDTT